MNMYDISNLLKCNGKLTYYKHESTTSEYNPK